MTLAPLFALALAAPFTTAQGSPPGSRTIGFARHVQLIEASVDERGQPAGRFVTVGTVVAPGEPEAPLGGTVEVRDLADPDQVLVQLEADAQRLPRTIFGSPPRFRYFPGERGSDRALVLGSNGDLQLRRVDDGRFRGSVNNVTAIHDAVEVSGTVIALPHLERSIGHARFTPDGGVDASGMHERALTGAFVRSADGADSEFVLVREIDGEVVVQLRAPDCSMVTRRGLGPDVAPPVLSTRGHVVRCDARRESGSLLVTISDPRHVHGVGGIGRIIACDLFAEDGPALQWDGRPWPSHAGGWPAVTLFGQAVELLPDITGDGVPDIAATAPSGNDLRPSLMALDGRTGAIVAEYVGSSGVRFGIDLSLDPTGRFLLATSIPIDAPDDPTWPGRVHVFRTPTAERPSFERLR